jgi:hypothetical protein
MGQAMVVPRCSLKWTLAEKENWIIKMQMLLTALPSKTSFPRCVFLANQLSV